MASARGVALRLLGEYEAAGKYVNLSLNSPAAAALSGEERSFLTVLLYTAVERKITLDYLIGALAGRDVRGLDPVTRDILRLGLVQLLYMDGVPPYAAVHETVALCRHPGERGFVNAVLRAAVRCDGQLPFPDRARNPARYLSLTRSFPLWMCRYFIRLYGETQAEALLDAFNRRAPLTLAVHPRRTDPDALCARLGEAGYPCARTPYSPVGVRLSGSADPQVLPGFSEGHFYVQDEASQLCALTPGISAARRTVDVCACPGGKSFTAALAMPDDGEVFSFDIHDSKLPLLTAGAERLGISHIRAAQRDARDPLPQLLGKVDRVICDVPCSGLGVLGKKPDLRYKTEEEVTPLPDLQRQILGASAGYLAPGGTLVYSTCTLRREENEEVVADFLASHPSFCAREFSFPARNGQAPLRSHGGMLTLSPLSSHTDGFFIALLQLEG